jgi:hypothetical protein
LIDGEDGCEDSGYMDLYSNCRKTLTTDLDDYTPSLVAIELERTPTLRAIIVVHSRVFRYFYLEVANASPSVTFEAIELIQADGNPVETYNHSNWIGDYIGGFAMPSEADPTRNDGFVQYRGSANPLALYRFDLDAGCTPYGICSLDLIMLSEEAPGWFLGLLNPIDHDTLMGINDEGRVVFVTFDPESPYRAMTGEPVGVVSYFDSLDWHSFNQGSQWTSVIFNRDTGRFFFHLNTWNDEPRDYVEGYDIIGL